MNFLSATAAHLVVARLKRVPEENARTQSVLKQSVYALRNRKERNNVTALLENAAATDLLVVMGWCVGTCFCASLQGIAGASSPCEQFPWIISW